MKTPVVITGRMVLLCILSFFSVIFVINGALVYFAMDSWPGLTTESAYQQGRDYNQTLASADIQNALGWTSDLTFSKKHDRHVLRAEFTDAGGAPLGGLQVRVTFLRPVGEESVVSAALPEISKGEYSSPVALPFAGRWYADVEAGTDDAVRYRMRYEVTAAP